MRLEIEDATATASLRISGTAATDFLERALEGGGTRTPLEHYRTTLERCMPELLGRVDRKNGGVWLDVTFLTQRGMSGPSSTPSIHATDVKDESTSSAVVHDVNSAGAQYELIRTKLSDTFINRLTNMSLT